MKLGFQFDARSVRPSDPDGGSQLPLGNQPVVITANEIKPNSDTSSGHHVALTLDVIDGPNKGARGIYRLNMFHVKDDVKKIAAEQMSAICWVTGVPVIDDLDQLHGKPFIACVEAQQDPKYTQVRGVLDINGDKPGQPGVKGSVRPTQAAAPAAAASAGGGWAPPGNAPAPAPVHAPVQAPAPAGFAPPAAAAGFPAPQVASAGFAAPAAAPAVTAGGWGGAAQAPAAAPAAGGVPAWAQAAQK